MAFLFFMQNFFVLYFYDFQGSYCILYLWLNSRPLFLLVFYLPLFHNCFFLFLSAMMTRLHVKWSWIKWVWKTIRWLVLLISYNSVYWRLCMGGSVLETRFSKPSPIIFLNNWHLAYVYQYNSYMVVNPLPKCQAPAAKWFIWLVKNRVMMLKH